MAYSTFLRGVLEDPRAVSTPLPSGPILATRLAAEIDPSVPGTVVELGPGTGAVTEALIRRGVTPDRLLLVERSPHFFDVLTRRFPSAKIVKDDAWLFERHLDGPLAAVMSGLPLLNFAQDLRRSLVEKALGLQGAKGRFIQVSYGWRPAVPAGPSIAIKKSFVWRNVPPAHIWTYRRPPGR